MGAGLASGKEPQDGGQWGPEEGVAVAPVGEGGVENDLAWEDGGGEGGGPLPWEQATAEGPSPTEGRDVP